MTSRPTAALALMAATLALAGCASSGGSAPGTMAMAARSTPVDNAMTCEQIAAEIAQQDALIAKGEKAQVTNAIASAGTGAVVNTAVLAGAGRFLPGIGTVASVANGVRAMGNQTTQNQAVQAQSRKAHLVGLYNGKGCA